jgi:hypothetical protein
VSVVINYQIERMVSLERECALAEGMAWFFCCG